MMIKTKLTNQTKTTTKKPKEKKSKQKNDSHVLIERLDFV